MAFVQTLVLLASVLLASAQRPSFAGFRPIGFPELVNRTTTLSGLQDKFGEVTTQRLPIEAQGDRDLVDRLSKLPIDKQPFWFINWQALEAERGKPQTYPQRPNPFLADKFQNTNSAQNQNPGVTSSQTFTASNVPSDTGNSSPGQVDAVKDNSNLNNRYGTEVITAGSTGINNSNAATINNHPAQITPSNNDVKKPILTQLGSTSPNPGNKINVPIVVQEENEFEDIEVRKTVRQY